MASTVMTSPYTTSRDAYDNKVQSLKLTPSNKLRVPNVESTAALTQVLNYSAF